jgi:hypothetical protein
VSLRLKNKVLTNDARVPGPARGRDQPCNQIGEDPR